MLKRGETRTRACPLSRTALAREFGQVLAYSALLGNGSGLGSGPSCWGSGFHITVSLKLFTSTDLSPEAGIP